MIFLGWIEWLVRVAVLSWIDLRKAGVLRILVPYFTLQVLALYACAVPVTEFWAGVVVPVVGRVFGDYYLHYPQCFIGLPVTGSAARLVTELVMGPLVVGWCAWALRSRLEGERMAPRHLLRRGAALYPVLLGLGLLQVGVWLLCYGLPLTRLNQSGLLSYRLHSGLTALGGVLPVLLLAPLFYVVPHLVYSQSGLWDALRQSWRLFRRRWFPPVFLSLIPWAVGLPFGQLLQRSARLAGRLRPEMVFVVMVVETLVAILVAFFVLDAAMRLYRYPRTGDR